MKRVFCKNTFVLTILVILFTGNVAIASSSKTWAEAPTKYYSASKIYDNGSYDNYSFTIEKIAKTGETDDHSSYTDLSMWIVATNAKMQLEYQTTFQSKNTWQFNAAKNKRYSYNFIDKSTGTIGRYNTGLNVLIKSPESKNVNTCILHEIK